ncbi:MAG: thymidylate synthase, partial [Candidatus Peribacteraceae bacterium]|nr:thymidylate synthase [Candidatus Peribacteraceae bacterium]
YDEGRLCGFLGDTHIYHNHIKQVDTQIQREPYGLPIINTKKFVSIFDWSYTDSEIECYSSHPPIKAPIAI